MSDEYDLLVIGGGSGGVRAARWSGGLGAKVAICEEDRYGGTCVIRGCIPKKLMVYASEYLHEVEAMKNYGWDTPTPSLNWQRLKENRDNELVRLEGLYQKMLSSKNVEVLNGRGVVKSANEVEVAGKVYKAKNILIATGSRPSLPDVPGVEHALTSNEIFHLDEVPKRLAVVGAGFIALEFACIFKGLGSDVDVFVRSQMLRGFDRGCVDFLQQEMQRKGIRIHLGCDIQSLSKGSDIQIKTSAGEFNADTVLYATGRAPNTQNLGLEAAGVELDKKGAVVINERFQTNVPNVYAVGDVVDKINLTPVATAQGTRLAENLFNNGDHKMDYTNVPSAIFTQPPFSTVGLTEEEAQDVDVYKSDFRALKHTISGLEERTLMKLLVDKKSQKVVGAHMVGKDAAEIIQGVAIAIKAGATKADFDKTIGIHPTSAEEFVTMR